MTEQCLTKMEYQSINDNNRKSVASKDPYCISGYSNIPQDTVNSQRALEFEIEDTHGLGTASDYNRKMIDNRLQVNDRTNADTIVIPVPSVTDDTFEI